MGRERLSISIETARRVAVSAQGLDAVPRPAQVDVAAIEALVRRISYVQLDPISVVARSPLLVLWARLGPFPPSMLDDALYGQRVLFEHWAHAAAILPSADLPMLRWRMGTFAKGDSKWSVRIRDWMAENAAQAEAVLATLAADGPLPAAALADHVPGKWESDWSSGRAIDWMLEFLWMDGRVVVAGRPGGKRLWGVAEDWFPPGMAGAALDEPEAVRGLAERALLALGVGTEVDARGSMRHLFRYPKLLPYFEDLVASGVAVPISIEAEPGRPLKGEWFMHSAHLPILERIEAGAWQGRSLLLSPFDNLLIDRPRTEKLFGFEHRMEIYVPKAKRRWGYYVFPYLHGERFAGRLDLRADRVARRLEVLAVHAEPWAERRLPGGLRPLRKALEELANCCGGDGFSLVDGAREDLPGYWRRALS